MNELCNIDAHAKTMSDSAQAEVAAILAKRRAMDAQGNDDKPLVVLSGECHTNPREHIHHMLAIDGIRAVEPATGVAYEYEHNRALQEYRLSGRTLTPEAEAALTIANDRGALSLRTSYRPTMEVMALHSRAALFRYIQRSGLPFLFNDCARPHKYMIDFTDTSTAISAASYFKARKQKMPHKVNARSEHGIGLRNVHMADMALAFTERHKLRILFQQCGNAHVLGMGMGSPYDESLAALLKQDSAVSVMAIARGDTEEFYEAQDSGFLLAPDEVYFRPTIEGLNALYNVMPLFDPAERRQDKLFLMKLAKNDEESEDKKLLERILKLMVRMEELAIPVHLENRKSEAGYTNRLLSALGRDEDRMSVRTFRRWQAENTVIREKTFAACEKTNAAPRPAPAM